MYYGENTVEKVYFGTTEVDKIYLGTNTVYEAGGSSGVEPNVGDKILMQDFETNTRAYGNLTLSSDNGILDDTEYKMGSYSYRIKANDTVKGAKSLKYHIGQDYLGRNFTLEFFAKWSWTSGTAFFMQLMDSTSNTGIYLCTTNYGQKYTLYVNDFWAGATDNVGTSKEWNHIAITHDVQNGITLYVDGVKALTFAAPNLFRNGREYDLNFYCTAIANNSWWVDGINMEYGLKYTGDTYTVPTSYASGNIFTPSGTYTDNLTSHNLTYASIYTSKLTETDQTLPVTISTTESTLTRPLLNVSAEYTGSDTANIYEFNEWHYNNSYINSPIKFTTDLTVDADWTVRSASGSGIFLIGDNTGWSIDPDYEFVWSDADNCYILEDFYLAGSWKIGDDYFSQIDLGARTMNYELTSGRNYTMTVNGQDFYFGGVYVQKMSLDLTNNKIKAVYF